MPHTHAHDTTHTTHTPHRFQSHASRSVAVRNFHGCHGHQPTQEVLPRILHYPDDGKVRTLALRSPIFAVLFALLLTCCSSLTVTTGKSWPWLRAREPTPPWLRLSLPRSLVTTYISPTYISLVLMLACSRPLHNLARWFYRTSRRPCCC